jgi:hypothetical protein
VSCFGPRLQFTRFLRSGVSVVCVRIVLPGIYRVAGCTGVSTNVKLTFQLDRSVKAGHIWLHSINEMNREEYTPWRIITRCQEMNLVGLDPL